MTVSRYVRVSLDGSTFQGIRCTDWDFDVDRQVLVEELIEEDIPLAEAGGLRNTVTFTSNVRGEEFRPIFSAIIGSESYDDVNGVYSYAWGTPQKLAVVALGETIQTSGSTQEWSFSDVYISSVEFRFEPNSFVQATVNAVGTSLADGTFSAPSYSSKRPLVTRLVTLSLDTTTYYPKSVTLTIDRSIADDRYLVGQSTIDPAYYRVANINGSITFREEDLAEIKKAVYGEGATDQSSNELAEVVLEITAKSGSDDYIYIKLPAAMYTRGRASVRGRDEAERSVDFRMIKSEPTIEYHV